VLGVTEELLTASKRSSEGARRPLRTILKNPEIDAGLDEHGQFIRVAFDLPRGAYATVVLREIMKNDVVDDADAEE
jgi:tRNA pseudouridine13 synthase